LLLSLFCPVWFSWTNPIVCSPTTTMLFLLLLARSPLNSHLFSPTQNRFSPPPPPFPFLNWNQLVLVVAAIQVSQEPQGGGLAQYQKEPPRESALLTLFLAPLPVCFLVGFFIFEAVVLRSSRSVFFFPLRWVPPRFFYKGNGLFPRYRVTLSTALSDAYPFHSRVQDSPPSIQYTPGCFLCATPQPPFRVP